MRSIKVLFITQEVTPYLPDTPIALAGRNLPQGIRERGKEIRTFMPRWGCINERRNQLHEVIRLSGMNLVISDADHPLIIKVASIQSARMQVYFIDNEDYFQRRGMYTDEEGREYDDNDERSIFFARGVLETVKKLRWAPDIVHCHGWFACFIPVLLRKGYRDDPTFTKSRIIYTLYNDAFSIPLHANTRRKLVMDGLTKRDLEIIRTPSYLNIMQLAVKYTDGIIFGDETIDPTLAEHIKTTQKPVLSYQDSDTYIEATNQFYDLILNAPAHATK